MTSAPDSAQRGLSNTTKGRVATLACEYPMTCLAPTISALLGLPAPAQATESPIPAIKESVGSAERVAVVAPDALGVAILERWTQEMPFLTSLVDRRRVTLRAVMPTITPVNFATMVTGVVRDVHGIGAWKDDFTCETLFDGVTDQSHVNWYDGDLAVSRWFQVFNGLHCIVGNRSLGIVGWWKSRMPEANAKKAQLAPNDVILQLFDQLAEQSEKADMRYVLALLLARRRVVRPEESETDESGREVMVMYCPRRETTLKTPVVMPSDERAAEIQQELSALLYAEGS